MISHPASIDIVPFPSLRDLLLDNMQDGLRAVSEAGLDLDWPHLVNDALLHIDKKDGEDNEVRVFIPPSFARWLDDPKHWILGRKILEIFPNLADSEMTIGQENILTPADRWL